eukprot:593282-Prymnesium_polylepis.1
MRSAVTAKSASPRSGAFMKEIQMRSSRQIIVLRWLPPQTHPPPGNQNALVIPELAGSARKTEFLAQNASRLEIRSVLVSAANQPR